MNYLALTIGPLYKTSMQAKTTREYWVASYLFSKIAKTYMDYPIPGAELLSPQPVLGCTYGAGVYPDRVYWSLEKLLDWDKEMPAIEGAILKRISAETNNLLTIDELKSYLKLYWVQCSWTDEELKAKPFLFRLNEILDGLELEDKWENKQPTNIVEKLIAKGIEKLTDRPVYKWRKEFRDDSNCKNDKLSLKLFEDYGNIDIGRLPSIIEIGTRPLRKHYNEWYSKEITGLISQNLKDGKDEDKDDRLMQKIKEKYGDMFRSHHKYICIVQSDGDGVSNFLENEVKNDQQRLKGFSILLNDFAVSANRMIVEYGGSPVFAGGEDLVFFAPLKHQEENGKNIIHLLNDLDKMLQEKFPEPNKLTLSFGISVTYYKHPMAEAMKTAHYLLVDTAKKQPCKNYMAMKVQKHSGAAFHFGFRQEGPLYDCFFNLLNAAEDKNENFLNSLMYKLEDQKKTIEYIGNYNDKDGNEERAGERKTEKMKLFFAANFNETAHVGYKTFFDEAGILILETFNAFAEEELNQKMNRIYSALRFIHFLNAKDNNE